MLNSTLPTCHFVLLGHHPVNFILPCPIHQSGGRFYQRLVGSVMDQGCKGARADLGRVHLRISRHSNADRHSDVDLDPAAVVVNQKIANQRRTRHRNPMLSKELEHRRQASWHSLRHLFSLQHPAAPGVPLRLALRDCRLHSGHCYKYRDLAPRARTLDFTMRRIKLYGIGLSSGSCRLPYGTRIRRRSTLKFLIAFDRRK